MKSDREFIDGIYEKAKYYKEDTAKKKSKSNTYVKPALAIAMACCAVFLITINPSLKKKDLFNNDKVNQNKTRNIVPGSNMESQPIVLAGTLSDINENNKTFVIYNITSFSEGTKEIEDVILTFSDSDIDTLKQYKNNKVLVYVSEIDNKYMLEDGIRSIYILVDSGSDYELYEGVDGVTIDTRTIK